MKALHFIYAAALTLAAGVAFAQEPASFDEADMNGDGVLGHSEASQALPGVSIPDLNGDGVVNKGEVQEALPEVSLSGDDSEEVGEQAYRTIVQALED